jgi:cyclopropane fatty-acyl-phospholipid synthase-like methyltransferase
MTSMKGVNSYHKELSNEEIEAKAHRGFVGGLWEELGQLQFDFLINSGLKPDHKLLDIGCGCLRGGIHFVKYLNETNYYGLDFNQSLIEAGKKELSEACLISKKPNLIVDDKFSIDKLNARFDFMISVSVFTHLPMNIIMRCLNNAKKYLAHTGVYYSSFFQSPSSVFLEDIVHQPGGIVTNFDSDPFHYSEEELNFMATQTGLQVSVIGDWGHPRNQKMAAFRLAN